MLRNDPTGTQNGSPSHDRRASRSRGMDRRCRRRRHRRCPSPPEYECSCPASDRHGRGSRLLRVRQGRCLRYRHACHRRLPVFPDGQMPHSCRCCSKCPCCFSNICHARYCGNHYLQTYPIRFLSFLMHNTLRRVRMPEQMLLLISFLFST